MGDKKPDRIRSLKKLYSGKVRDLYEIDSDRMLMVASDRLSAFDVILDEPIPDKGKILTALSLFWFKKLEDSVPNHLTGDAVEAFVEPAEFALVEGRAVVVKRLTPLPIEAIVRGYLAGSAWEEYQYTRTISGIRLPENLVMASRLPEPIFTPTTKAAVGQHDESIDFASCCERIGAERAEQVRAIALSLYQKASTYAIRKGIIISDTKFEFGIDKHGTLTLMDEVLTPDSSRFWWLETYREGANQPSFDKQFIRDWMVNSGWNKHPPAPPIPLEIRQKTAEKYREALERLTS